MVRRRTVCTPRGAPSATSRRATSRQLSCRVLVAPDKARNIVLSSNARDLRLVLNRLASQVLGEAFRQFFPKASELGLKHEAGLHAEGQLRNNAIRLRLGGMGFSARGFASHAIECEASLNAQDTTPET